MNIKSIKINNSRLAEGKTFRFEIAKKISLGDTEEFFVLIDPMGYKIMLPAQYYKDYGFEAGQSINCRIDKISCNGQVFLEPQHPQYNENENYKFPVVETGIRKNILDENEYYFIVKDVFNNPLTVVSTQKLSPEILSSKSITCHVERIKKGKLFLRLADELTVSESLKIGEEHEFVVINERINPDDKLTYFILAGPDKKKHLINKKYYGHYGIKKGDTIRCKVNKFATEGFFSLEPENPHYKTGEVYDFKVKRFEELVYSDGLKQKVVVIEDLFRAEVNVFIDDEEYEKHKEKKQITALINNIRKSRLELQLI